MPSEIKLLAGTEIYYCFNSKGDNFKVNQLKNAAKKKLYVRDRMSCSIFNVQSMALKITCSNPRFTLDFVRKCLLRCRMAGITESAMVAYTHKYTEV